MAGAMRRAVLGHLRVPVVSHTSFSHSLHGSEKKLATPILVRLMSSHDDHLTKDQVIQRVLAVIKDFPKVDPSKGISGGTSVLVLMLTLLVTLTQRLLNLNLLPVHIGEEMKKDQCCNEFMGRYGRMRNN